MIDFYYWTTPNGQKVTIYLEELNHSGEQSTSRRSALRSRVGS